MDELIDNASESCGAPVPKRPGRLRWALRAIPFAAVWAAIFVAYRWPGDATPWGEWLTVWPPLLWTFVLVPLMLPLALGRSWKPSAAAGGMIVLFLLVHEEWASLLRFGKTPEPDLRVLTWNVGGHDLNDPKLLAILEKHRPDVVFLQETPDGNGSFAEANLAGFFAGFSWVDDGDCGILSRWPLRRLGTRSVGPWSDPQVYACETEPGRELLLVNVRLMLPSLRLIPLGESGRALREDNRRRGAQFPALAELVRETMAREGIEDAVLAGDFNTGAWARSLEPLREGLRDGWKDGGRGWGRTMTAAFPVGRIDQCWATAGLRCVRAEACREAISDHRSASFHFVRVSAPTTIR